MKINVPSKTFLVGEYSVLLGGASLGLATKPCFQLTIGDQTSTALISIPSFHPLSPAGLYLKKHDKTNTVVIEDPHAGHGGFGRSSAEYFAAILPDLLQSLSSSSADSFSAILSFHKILAEYKSLHSGSGMDLAFQYFGQICLAEPSLRLYQTFNWHFQNLDFYIVSTNFKVNTHDHISKLNLDALRDLPPLSDKITRVFAENKEFEFLSLMKEWCKVLESHQLTHPNSIIMRMQLEACESIKLAKPCGALGADVILVFFAKSHKETVKNFLVQNNFKIQAHSSDLVEGVLSQIKNIGNSNVD